jgi:hypothetical protein
MKWSIIVSTIVLAGGMAYAEGPAGKDRPSPGDVGNTSAAASARTPGSFALPPVLQKDEPTDNVNVTLPGSAPAQGPPPAAASVSKSRPAAPPHPVNSRGAAPAAPAPATASSTSPAPAAPKADSQPRDRGFPLVADAVIRRDPPAQPEEDPRPILHRPPKPILPSDFQRDSAFFVQKRIGEWTQPDAYNLLGAPVRTRPATDDGKTENGKIYAYSDPTARYRELELDFAADTGLLRTVFVYPWKMTWKDCLRVWGSQVTATDANKGRTFYSYVNRHVDVLVDATGKVISFGLY